MTELPEHAYENELEEYKSKPPVFSNAQYDTLKWVDMTLLPGFGAFYFAISQIWGLPYADKVTGTITAICVFLGLVLQWSSTQYKQNNMGTGEAHVDLTNPSAPIRLSLDHSPEEMATKDKIQFKVVNHDA